MTPTAPRCSPHLTAALSPVPGRAAHPDYVNAAGAPKTGACHLFRHTMATLMLEGGADIRYIQAMLGHAEVSTTQIYAHVSVSALQAIHAATHPAATHPPAGCSDHAAPA